ncbi:MAG: hypothetical protein KKB37_11785 [Alphaproteobacteria bacterium]|nr:hypothetical protein [Alphaproteobacteria bacterium]
MRLLAVASLMVTYPAAASPVEIRSGSGASNVAVSSDGATLVEIVVSLGNKYGFAVEVIGDPPGRRVHGSYEGPLETVVQRLLRHENFVLIREPDPPTGFDFQPPPPRRRHMIRIVKLLGSGTRNVIRHDPDNVARPDSQHTEQPPAPRRQSEH